MGFRFRRSARLGPLRFNFSKGGLSSISVGRRGASFNIPVARRGSARSTVGLLGTGLSWSVEHTPSQGLPNSRRLRPGQLDAFRQSVHAVLMEQLFAPGSSAAQLWELGLVSQLLGDGSIGARTAGLLAVIETPEALSGYLLRSQSQDDAKRRGQRCIEATQLALQLSATRGWINARSAATSGDGSLPLGPSR